MISVLENGVLGDFDFFKWISGELPELTLLMSTWSRSEMALEITNLLSIDYHKSFLSIKSPDVIFWLSTANGHFSPQIVSKSLIMYGSSSTEDALLNAVSSEIGETPTSLRQSSDLDFAKRYEKSEIVSLLKKHVSNLISQSRIEPKICPLSPFTLQPIKGLEALPRETDSSSIIDFTLRLSRALSLVRNVDQGYSSEIGYLVNHVIPLRYPPTNIIITLKKRIPTLQKK